MAGVVACRMHDLLPLDPGARRAILSAVDSLAADSADALAALVRHRSVLGQEQPCIAAMETTFRDLGLDPWRVPVGAELADRPGWSPPLLSYAGRDNVVAVHRPRSVIGRSLLLQGHVDVVPEGAADLWTTPPFEPTIRGGRIYGRGTADMKAGLVAMTMALRALHRAGLQPAAPLQLAAVIEEECTGNGALAVLHALPKPDAVLIPEPGPGYPALYVAEVGVVWAWITVTGRPAHVREMHSGVNAIEAAYVVMEHARAYEAVANRAERRHPAFAAENHPINVNVGSIQGGEWTSSVATRAELSLRVGVMPGQSSQAVKQEIEAMVHAASADPKLRGATLQVAFRGFMADGCVFPPTQAISRVVSALHADRTGETLRHYNATGLTDARHYVLHQGTEATCYGPDADNIHGIDESVGLDSLATVTQVLALLIAGWCGVEAKGA